MVSNSPRWLFRRMRSAPVQPVSSDPPPVGLLGLVSVDLCGASLLPTHSRARSTIVAYNQSLTPHRMLCSRLESAM